MFATVSAERSRSDQLPQADLGRAHEALYSFFCLAPAAGGGIQNPVPLAVSLGSGALYHSPRAVFTEVLGVELRRMQSGSSFRWFFQHFEVAALCGAIRDWMLAQIFIGVSDVEQLICDEQKL